VISIRWRVVYVRAMPIEPPNPNNDVPLDVDMLRAVLVNLQAAARVARGDSVLLGAVGHVGAAVALLEVRAAARDPAPSSA
jgi:hypothetical protein